MESREEKFIALWNAGVKFSDIEEALNLDHNGVSYLRRSLHVAPRRNDAERKAKREEVWDMIVHRVPIETITAEKGVTEIYVRQTINKRGYSIRDFYEKTTREKKEEADKKTDKEPVKAPKEGVRCTESVMQKCIYGTYDCCMYCVIERHRRPCPPEACTCYKRKPKGFKQRSWTFE